MKKLITALALTVAATSAMAVEPTNQSKITSILAGAGLQSMWAGPANLWVKSPGPQFDKYTLESFAHQLCAGTQGKGVGGYRVTFWHQFGSGEITRVHCSS